MSYCKTVCPVFFTKVEKLLDVFPLFISKFNECHAYKSGFILEPGPVKILFTVTQEEIILLLTQLLYSNCLQRVTPFSTHFQPCDNKIAYNFDNVESKDLYVKCPCNILPQNLSVYATLSTLNHSSGSFESSCLFWTHKIILRFLEQTVVAQWLQSRNSNCDLLTLKNYFFVPLLNSLTARRIK